MKLRYKIVAVVSGLLLIFGWGWYLGRPSGPKPKPVLPVNDTAQITVNPSNHTVTVLTPNGSNTSFLPDAPTVIDIEHGGVVKVTAKQYGLETEGFGGVGYAERARFICGLDLLYFRRFDLGVGGSLSLSSMSLVNSRAALTLSYTLTSNTRATIAYDNHQRLGAFVTLRF